MRSYISLSFALFLLLFLPWPALPQTAAQNDSILKRLDRLERQNAELLEQIKLLRQAVEPASQAVPAATAAPAAGPAPEQPIEDRQEVSEHRIEELAQTKVEASQRFPIQLTGMALFNAFTNGTNNGGSQDPSSASLTPGPRNSGGSFRQSILGVRFNGPRTFLGGSVSGFVSMDFFGGTNSSVDHLLRLRVANVQLDWNNTTLAIGMDKPIVSKREPNSLAQVGVPPLTGTGNLWRWEPQVRLEHRFRLSDRTEIKAEGGLYETDESGGAAVYSATQLSTETEPPVKTEEYRPAFEARVSVKHQFTDSRSLEIAPVFHISTSHVAGVSVPSRLYGVDWLLKPASKLEISGLFFTGRNFANLGALGGFTVLTDGTVLPVHGTGGWMQFRYLATPKLSFDFYGGQQDDRNRDLKSGLIERNQYYAANAMYLLSPNVMTSFEFGQNRTKYLDAGHRLNNHFDLALAYLF